MCLLGRGLGLSFVIVLLDRMYYDILYKISLFCIL